MKAIIRNPFSRTGSNNASWAYWTALFGLVCWRVVGVIGLTVCVSFMEGLGLLLLVQLLPLVGLETGEGSVGQLAEFVSSVFGFVGVRPTLEIVLIIYVFVFGFQSLLKLWQTTANSTLTHLFALRLQERLYRAIANVNWLFFCRHRSSDFFHALTEEIGRVGTATDYLLVLVVNAVIAVAYILMALKVSVAITVLAFTCGAGMLILLKKKTDSARLSGEALTVATNELYAAVSEHLAGMKTVKSYGAEDRNIGIFSMLSNRVTDVYIDAVRGYARVKFWFDIGSILVLSLILIVSIDVLSTPAVEVLLLIFLFGRIMPRFSSIQQSYQLFANALPAFRAVSEMQACCEAEVEMRPPRTGAVKLRRDICLDQVSFSYQKDGSTVLQDIDLVIRAGQTTAIVGPSGAGKSTIADLLIGLIGPTTGQVIIDGVPLTAERLRAWRDCIGYVAQDTFLFNDTVRANLLWACPDATDEELREAIRQAAAEEFVLSLPKEMETILGDRGVRLSGGERQRLALARALLRKPALLILDEATSSLDSENEKRIQFAIEELHGHMTILVISHRLPTIRESDVIYVLEQGSIVESGDWDTLLANENGRFVKLCQAQGIDTAQEKQTVSFARPF